MISSMTFFLRTSWRPLVINSTFSAAVISTIAVLTVQVLGRPLGVGVCWIYGWFPRDGGLGDRVGTFQLTAVGGWRLRWSALVLAWRWGRMSHHSHHSASHVVAHRSYYLYRYVQPMQPSASQPTSSRSSPRGNRKRKKIETSTNISDDR